MKASEKEILTAFLGKTLNMPTDEVAQLFEKNGEEEDLKSDSLKTLLTHDATRVKGFKDENTTHFENGQKKATKEFGTNRDKELKEKFGVTSDKIGLELVEEIITSKTSDTAPDAEKIKIHPEYLKMEKELNKKLVEEKALFDKKFNDRETELAAEKTFSEIVTLADLQLANIKPILPKDAEKAKNQKQLLINELKGMKYEKQGNEIVILKPDGKRLEDEHGKPINFETLIKTTASKYWDFENGTTKQGSGGTNDNNDGTGNGAGGTKWQGAIPKNDEEYSAIFLTLKTAEDRVLFNKAVEASQKTT